MSSTKIRLLRNGKVTDELSVEDFMNTANRLLNYGEPLFIDNVYYETPKMFIGDCNNKIIFIGPYKAGSGVKIDNNVNSVNLGTINLEYPIPAISGSDSGKILTVNETGDNIVWSAPNIPYISYGTVAEWASQTDYIPKIGEIVLYTDKYEEVKEDGTVIKYPGVKIGSGNGYVGDLRFLVDDYQLLLELKKFKAHIANAEIHVSSNARAFWNHKIDIANNDVVVDENLVFTRDMFAL